MEVGDENLPPSSHSWTGNPICASPRSPGAVRPVLVDVNTSVHEAKSSSEAVGSGTAEEEKCEVVSTDPEVEAWSERTAVITRYDHETHCNLARGFVEDIADKVVEENWNKEPETKKEFKPPNSLSLKKQLLFLPDLVPNVVVSQTPTTDTVSESDEYESADEQPHFHETLYLDSTVNALTGVNASTPIDCPGWHLDFDSSHVLPVGDVTVDASLKDYSLPVIDRAPESLSGVPQALNEEVASEEETDGLGAIKNFPQTARTTQHFSPSSGSDVDVSVVESEADTLAALTPNNPTSEVDVDLIKQFERLVLCKQIPAQNSPATPTLNTTFPLSENTPATISNETCNSVNETCNSVNETGLSVDQTGISVDQTGNSINETVESVNDYEDILPADATRDVLSVTQDVSNACPDESSAYPDESELAIPFTDLDQSSFIDQKNSPELAYTSAVEEQLVSASQSLAIVEDQSASIVEESSVPIVKESTVPIVEESTVPVVKDSTVPIVEDSTVPVVEDSTVPVVEDSTVPVVEDSTVPVEELAVPAEEEKTSLIVEESSPAVVEDISAPVSEEPSVPAIKESTVEEIAPATEEPPTIEESTAPVVDESVDSVIDESLAPVVEYIVPPVEEQFEPTEKTETPVTLVNEELPVPAIEEQLSLTQDVEPAEIIHNEIDAVPADDESTVLSAAEQTVLNAADRSNTVEVNEPATEEPQPSTLTEEDPEASEVSHASQVSSNEAETSKAKPTSLPEEKPIVPKKGYDLSFLDRFDDLENATPSISQAKLLLPSTPASDATPAADKVSEPQPPEAAATPPVDDQQVEIAESACSTVQTDADHQIPVAVPDPETPAQEEITVEAQPELPAQLNNITQDYVEEPLIVPKKGYDLSFLDKLDDLENASPTAKGSQEPTMKENMSAKEETTEPIDEQPSLEAKPEKPAESSSPAKKGPAVRKPIRPRVARPAAAAKTDPFEVEFTFDPNEDPFKSKKKLDASPTREGSPTSQNFPDANTTINAENANDTVIEDIPESASPKLGTVNSRLSNGDDEQEEFRPAQEVFHDPSELDFLMQHGGSSNDIALARQSLFVKFDPLVTGRPSMFPSRSSDGGADETILADDPTGSRKSAGESLFLFSPPHPSSGGQVKSEKTEQTEKPAQQECLMSSRNVTGDVLSLNEHKEALKLQELLFQDKLLQKEREILMRENENHDIKSKLEATVEAQAQMRQIVGEYEKTISQLIAEKEREKANMEATLQNTIKERDQAIEDLKEVERAFSEFHRMYERNRAAAENLHKNEEALKKALAAYQERLQQEQHKYETLKLHAAQKLEGAQQEMENLKRNLEGESSRVKAQLKKTEMRLASVETSLEQKSKENEELTTLCDELINKLGSSAK